MLFDKVFGYTDAIVAEVGGVIYVGGQGYKADTLERIEGKRLTNPRARGTAPRSPLVFPRMIQESTVFAYTPGLSLGQGDAVSTDLINSDPSIRSNIQHSMGNVMVTGTYPTANVIGKVTVGDGDPVIDNPGVQGATPVGAGTYGTRLAALLKVGSNIYDFSTDSDPFLPNGYNNTPYMNGVSGIHLRQGMNDIYAGALYRQPGQAILDMDATGILVPYDRFNVTSYTNRVLFRVAANTLALTSITFGALSYQTPAGNNGMAAPDQYVAIPAFTVNGKRRLYYVNPRYSGPVSYTSKCAVQEYTDVASFGVAQPPTAIDIKLNGFTLRSSAGLGCTPYAYVIRGSGGKNYIVIFFTRQNGYSKGDWIVLEENGLADLTVVAQGEDERFGGMRALLSTSNNNDEWLVHGMDGVYRWAFDHTTKSPKPVNTVFEFPVAGLGIDSYGRTWAIERLPNQLVPDHNSIHVLPQAGVTAFASTQFEANSYSYSIAPIATNVLVKLTDLNQSIIAGKVRVNLEGKCTFLDGTVSKEITTTAGVVTMVPVQITGTGSLGVTGTS